MAVDVISHENLPGQQQLVRMNGYVTFIAI